MHEMYKAPCFSRVGSQMTRLFARMLAGLGAVWYDSFTMTGTSQTESTQSTVDALDHLLWAGSSTVCGNSFTARWAGGSRAQEKRAQWRGTSSPLQGGDVRYGAGGAVRCDPPKM